MGPSDEANWSKAIYRQQRRNGTAIILNPKTQDTNPAFR